MKQLFFFSICMLIALPFQAQTIQDIDGNEYDVVMIGSQHWLAKNLTTSRYQNGDPISRIMDHDSWVDATNGAYCWYADDSVSYETIYGKMYNWLAVNTGQLCPAGWHVPDDGDWEELIDHLGGAAVAGGKLKEAGFDHWLQPNTDATNESGFTALPGGSRYTEFYDIGKFGSFWSATNLGGDFRKKFILSFANSAVETNLYPTRSGSSVRCIEGDVSSMKKATGQKGLKIYPNPARDRLYIECPDGAGSRVSLFDLQGSLVLQASVSNNYLDIPNLPKGMYILIVQAPSGPLVQKFVRD